MGLKGHVYCAMCKHDLGTVKTGACGGWANVKVKGRFEPVCFECADELARRQKIDRLRRET